MPFPHTNAVGTGRGERGTVRARSTPTCELFCFPLFINLLVLLPNSFPHTHTHFYTQEPICFSSLNIHHSLVYKNKKKPTHKNKKTKTNKTTTTTNKQHQTNKQKTYNTHLFKCISHAQFIFKHTGRILFLIICVPPPYLPPLMPACFNAHAINEYINIYRLRNVDEKHEWNMVVFFLFQPIPPSQLPLLL